MRTDEDKDEDELPLYRWPNDFFPKLKELWRSKETPKSRFESVTLGKRSIIMREATMSGHVVSNLRPENVIGYTKLGFSPQHIALKGPG